LKLWSCDERKTSCCSIKTTTIRTGRLDEKHTWEKSEDLLPVGSVVLVPVDRGGGYSKLDD
jgi:hypothetical protein